MLADGARTGTVGYGEQDGPPRGPWTRAAAVPSRAVSGTVGWARWARRPPSSTSGTIRRPDLIVAPAGRGGGPRLPGCLFAPGSPRITAPRVSLPSSARTSVVARVGAPRRRSVAVPTALRQAPAGGCARRPRHGRGMCVSCARCGPPRVPRLPARRQPGNSAPGAREGDTEGLADGVPVEGSSSGHSAGCSPVGGLRR